MLNVQYKNVDRTTGIQDPGLAGADLKIYPNPAEDHLQIRASHIPPGSYTLVIYNVLGMELWRKSYQLGAGQLEEELDIARFEKGVYLCRFTLGRELMGQVRFVKN